MTLGEVMKGISFLSIGIIFLNTVLVSAAIGDIQDSVVSEWGFEVGDANYPLMINVNNEIYAVVYQGLSSDGFIRTMNISDNGVIINNSIRVFEFDNSSGETPDIINISDNIFAIAYEGGGVDGYVTTVNISDDGTIIRTIDTLEFDDSNGETPDIIHVSGDVYAIVYEGGGGDGFVVSVNITSNGDILDSVIDSLEFDQGSGLTPTVASVDSNTFITAYTGSGSDGFVATFDIDSSGVISNSVIDSFEFDNVSGITPFVVNVAGETFAVFYESGGSDGFVSTFNVTDAGIITDSVTEEQEYNGANGEYPCAYKIADNVFAISYEGADSKGFISTLNISDSGDIAESLTDTLEFETSSTIFIPYLTNLAGDNYAITYSYDSQNGKIVTLNITSSGDVGNSVIDSYFLGNGSGQGVDLIEIRSNIYAIVYEGINGAGFIKTFNIYTNGSFNRSFIDSLKFNETASMPRVIPVSGDVYAIVYEGVDGDGFVASVNITSNGEISDSVIDIFEFDSTDGDNSEIINISDNIFAIVYQGPDSDGFIRTINISNNGTVNSAIDLAEFDSADGDEGQLIHFYEDIYAIVYEGPGADGFIRTINISNNGAINGLIDVLEFDTGNGEFPIPLKLSNQTLAVVYEGEGGDGFIRTINISNNGSIIGEVDFLEYDTIAGTQPSVTKVFGDIYTIAYQGPGADGFVATVNISSKGDIGASTIEKLEYDGEGTLAPKIIHHYGNYFLIGHEGDSNAGGDNAYLEIVEITRDETVPTISNMVYSPNLSGDIDPGTLIYFNATVSDSSLIDSVILQYYNGTSWINSTMSNLEGDIYNTTITTYLTEINYTFNIFARDESGNSNQSANQTFQSLWDCSWAVTSSLQSVAGFSENKSVGIIWINNTGDRGYTNNCTLNFTLTHNLDEGRIIFNGSSSKPTNFTNLAAGNNLSIEINASFGSTKQEEAVVITSEEISNISDTETANTSLTLVTNAGGPYLDSVISSSPSVVYLTAQNISLQGYVKNIMGSATSNETNTAYNVSLNWSLPTGFINVTGNLSSNFENISDLLEYTSNIDIEFVDLTSMSSGVRTFTLNARGVNLTGSAIEDVNGNTTFSDSIKIAFLCYGISDGVCVSDCGSAQDPDCEPETVVQEPTPTGGGGGGGTTLSDGGNAEAKAFTETIEVVRGGDELSFDIEVTPNYANTTLSNLTLELTGFLEQYVDIFPQKILQINYGEVRNFTVVINAPSYKEHEEYKLIVIISGNVIRGSVVNSYVEKHTINLAVQEVSFEDSSSLLNKAQKYIDLMKGKGFNIDLVESLFEQAQEKLESKKNKEAYDLGEEIIMIKDRAFFVNDFIRGLIEIEKNPDKSYLLAGRVVDAIESTDKESFFDFFTGRAVLTGNVVGEADSGEIEAPLGSLISGNAVFSSESIRELLNLAIVAFQRGDYDLAEERAEAAHSMLVLERKGNLGLFLYLYWHFVFIFMVIFLWSGIFVHKKYQQSSLIKNINDNNREEKSVQNIMIKSQKDYFNGKISPEDYKKSMRNSKKKLASLKENRQKLRRKRLKALKSGELLKCLEIERKETENRIKKLQADYYVEQKISQEEYDFQFEMFSERLAEIEEECAAINLEKEKKIIVGKEKKPVRKEILQKRKVKTLYLGETYIDLIRNFFHKLKDKFNKRSLG